MSTTTRPTSRRATGHSPHTIDAETLRTVILVGAVLVASWPLYLAFISALPLHTAPVLAHTAGMLAGYGVVVLIGLMSRAPMLEHGVGADRLARWHAIGGRTVVSLILIHAGAAVVAYMQARQEPIWTALWHVERLPWLIAATLATASFVAVGIVSARAVRRRVTHETWHLLHLLVYIAAALGFVHQLGGPDLAGHRILQVAWALLYTLVFALVAIHRVLTPLHNAARHRMRVVAVVPAAPGVVSVEVEGVALDELCSQPGQFFRWRFLTPDLWRNAHPFSLSASPTPTRLRLTVKSLGDGSGFLQALEPGTWVIAEGPYGVMTAGRRTRGDVLLIAGGVGITPMRALFQSLPLTSEDDLVLLYRARSEADLIFREELDELARRRGARIVYLVGPAAPAFSPGMLAAFAPNLPDRDVYMCGPPAMTTKVRAALRSAGLPASQLHEERFGH